MGYYCSCKLIQQNLKPVFIQASFDCLWINNQESVLKYNLKDARLRSAKLEESIFIAWKQT